MAYEDALYRRLPGAIDSALEAMRSAAAVIAGARTRHAKTTLAAKRAAVACYASQLRGLATPGRLGHEDALRPERYWPITMARN